MTLVLSDRVQETSTSTGSGPFTLAGAVTGFQAFSAGIGNGNTTYYTITDNVNWMSVLGTYTLSSNQLSVTSVLSSSNNGAAVTFASGTKYVFCSYPSKKSVFQDANNNAALNNQNLALTSITSAAGTTTLTAASTYYQRVTGTLTQTIKLPDQTTIPVGTAFFIDNDSTQAISIQDSSGAVLASPTTLSASLVYSLSNTTSSGNWGVYAYLPIASQNPMTTNDAVAGVNTVPQLISAANLQAGVGLFPGFALSGISWGIMDLNNKLSIWIDNSGGFFLPVVGNIKNAIISINNSIATLTSLTDTTTYNKLSGIFWGIIDSNNKLALSINTAGKVIFGKGGDIDTRVSAVELTTNVSDTSAPLNGYALAWEDATGKVCGGINKAGSLITKGINVTTFINTISSGLTSITNSIAAINAQLTPSSGYWWYGDSLTASGVNLWSTLLSRSVTTKGVGGQVAQQIAARFGGQAPLFTVAGNTIPASGSVAVTSRSIELITQYNTSDSFSGKLFGIQGTYTSDNSTYWTFTRTTAGTAIAIDPNTPFLIDIIDSRFSGTNIFWYGRNNVGATTFNTDVKQTISDSIAKLNTLNKRFVIISVLNWPTETIGTANYIAVLQLNSDLQKLYPNNFVDVRNLLIRNGNGSVDDNTNVANDIIPVSLRNSPTDGHLNTAGLTIVGTRVSQFLNQMGW